MTTKYAVADDRHWIAEEPPCQDEVETFDLTFQSKGVASPEHVKDAIEEAKRICNEECPFQAECLEWAVSQHQDHGCYGGMMPTNRKRLRSKARAVYEKSQEAA